MNLMDIKTATITSKGQIAIPKEVRIIKGLKDGSKVAILTYKDRIEIRPMSELNDQMTSAFATERVLAKDWNSKEEDDAWKNL